MAQQTGLMAELVELGERFWAGEAEIARTFLTSHPKPEDHAQWLRHQCYRELRGPGLLARPRSHTSWVIDNINDGLSVAETKEGRALLEYQLGQIREEFTHFRLYADMLEDITGEPVRMLDLRDLTPPSDRRIEEMRSHLSAEDERLAYFAYSFAEGGGAGIFYAAAALETDDPLLLRIKDAGRLIFDDEVGHGEHNYAEIEESIESDPGEYDRLRNMLVKICQKRLRMRAEMFGIPISEERIQEITDGQIEPLTPLA